MKKLKDNIKNFMKEIKKYEIESITDTKLQKYFDMYNLNIDNLIGNYVEEIYHLEK
ncbi:hypothetical protein [Clostridioides difficile]|uniref:hypothetical protein n=1 Tax=Clostridioides difficile TaxID=1496 RepID=UPI001EDA22E3|nr:hypothetical protein [Clostridioides difficile]